MTDEREPTQEEINKALFSQLVIMLATSAIQQLGKLVNPVTKKAEVNLGAAQATIDLLDMLEAKTKGNLDKEEQRLLTETLMSVKMNFVETMQSVPEPAADEAAKEPSAPASEPEPSGGADDKQPKFHKKYE
ncbi:MAG: DUF1844 domain-containing protein [Verrucomicrobiota bacterium]